MIYLQHNSSWSIFWSLPYLQFQKKMFIPNIEAEPINPLLARQSSSEKAAAEAKTLRETRAALKEAEKKILITAIKKNSSVSSQFQLIIFVSIHLL